MAMREDIKELKDMMEQMMDMMEQVMGKMTLMMDIEEATPPKHTASNPCTGKDVTEKMQNHRVDFANPDEHVGLDIRGSDKQDMPSSGDVMMYKKNTIHGRTNEYTAQTQDMDTPSGIKIVHSGRIAYHTSDLQKRTCVETGGKKTKEPRSLKSNQPRQPLMCDTLKNSEGLSHATFMDGSSADMPG